MPSPNPFLDDLAGLEEETILRSEEARRKVSDSRRELEASGYDLSSSAAQALASVTGSEAAQRVADRHKKVAQVKRDNTDFTQSLWDVDGVGSALSYAHKTAIDAVPSLALAAAGGVAGVAARTALGLSVAPSTAAGAGMFAATYLPNTGEVFDAMREQAGDGNENVLAGVALGAGSTALDLLGVGRVARETISRTGHAVEGSLARRAGVTAAKTAGEEGWTEAAQNLASEAGRAVVDPSGYSFDKEALKRTVESGVAGAIGGIGPGALHGAASGRKRTNSAVDKGPGGEVSPTPSADPVSASSTDPMSGYKGDKTERIGPNGEVISEVDARAVQTADGTMRLRSTLEAPSTEATNLLASKTEPSYGPNGELIDASSLVEDTKKADFEYQGAKIGPAYEQHLRDLQERDRPDLVAKLPDARSSDPTGARALVPMGGSAIIVGDRADNLRLSVGPLELAKRATFERNGRVNKEGVPIQTKLEENWAESLSDAIKKGPESVTEFITGVRTQLDKEMPKAPLSLTGKFNPEGRVPKSFIGTQGYRNSEQFKFFEKVATEYLKRYQDLTNQTKQDLQQAQQQQVQQAAVQQQAQAMAQQQAEAQQAEQEANLSILEKAMLGNEPKSMEHVIKSFKGLRNELAPQMKDAPVPPYILKIAEDVAREHATQQVASKVMEEQKKLQEENKKALEAEQKAKQDEIDRARKSREDATKAQLDIEKKAQDIAQAEEDAKQKVEQDKADKEADVKKSALEKKVAETKAKTEEKAAKQSAEKSPEQKALGEKFDKAIKDGIAAVDRKMEALSANSIEVTKALKAFGVDFARRAQIRENMIYEKLTSEDEKLIEKAMKWQAQAEAQKQIKDAGPENVARILNNLANNEGVKLNITPEKVQAALDKAANENQGDVPTLQERVEAAKKDAIENKPDTSTKGMIQQAKDNKAATKVAQEELTKRAEAVKSVLSESQFARLNELIDQGKFIMATAAIEAAEKKLGIRDQRESTFQYKRTPPRVVEQQKRAAERVKTVAKDNSALSGTKVVDSKGNPKKVFHGTIYNFKQFSKEKLGSFTPSPSSRQGFFFTDRKKTAKYYSRFGGQTKEQTNIEVERLRNGFEFQLKSAENSYRLNPTEENRQKIEQLQSELESIIGRTVKEVYLNIRNPLVHDFKNKVFRDEAYNALLIKAKEEGRDGAIFKNTYDSGEYSRFDAIVQGRFKGETIYVAFSPEQIVDFNEANNVRDQKSSKLAANVGDIGLARAKNLIGGWTKNWTNAPNFTYVNTEAEPPYGNPEALKHYLRYKQYQGERADGRGPKASYDYDTKSVVIYSGSLQDEAGLKGTVFHEALGHYGLSEAFGIELNSLLQDIYQTTPEIQKLADTYSQDYFNKAKPETEHEKSIVTEEALVNYFNSYDSGKATNVKLGWIERFNAFLDRFFRRMGWRNGEAYTNAEIRSILEAAQDKVMKGEATGVYRTGDGVEISENYRERLVPEVKEAIAKLPEALQPQARTTYNNMQSMAKQGLHMVSSLRDFVNRNAEKLPALRDYHTHMLARDAIAREMEGNLTKAMLPSQEVKTVAKRREMAKVGIELSRLGEWPFQPSWRTDRVDVTSKSTALWNTLDDKQKTALEALYKYGHEALVARAEAVKGVINQRLEGKIWDSLSPGEKAEVKKDVARQLKIWDTKINQVKGPYVPFSRFGKYATVVRSPEFMKLEKQIEDDKDKAKKEDIEKLDEMRTDQDHYRVMFSKSLGVAKELELQIKNEPDYKGMHIESFQREAIYKQMQSAPWAGLQNMVETIKSELGSTLSEAQQRQIEDALKDIYFKALAENSTRRHLSKRKNVPGMSENLLHGFAETGKSDASFTANVRKNKDITESINKMREQRDEGNREGSDDRNDKSLIVNEVLHRHAMGMATRATPIVDTITNVTSGYFLLSSFRYYIQQAIQTPMMSAPYMSGRFGAAKTWPALFQSVKDLSKSIPSMWDFAIKGKFDTGTLNDDGTVTGGTLKDSNGKPLPQDELQMINHLRQAGVLDVGLQYELGSWENYGDTGFKSEFKNVMHTAKKITRAMEIGNRMSAGLAGYRMARESGMNYEQARNYTEQMLADTHGDYTAVDRPRAFGLAGSPGKLFFQFRRYSHAVGSMLAKQTYTAFKDSNPTERRIARKVMTYMLAQTALVTGTMGLPMVSTIAYLMAAAFGPDDEPADADRWLRNAIGDDNIADIILKGIPNVAGLDLQSMLGMENVFKVAPFVEPDFTTRDKAASTIFYGLGGAFGGLVGRGADAMGHLSEGNYWKGAENLSPGSMRTAMSAIREHNYGVTKKNGDMVISPEEFSFLESFMKGIGLNTTHMETIRRERSDMFKLDEYFKDRTSDMRKEYVEARKDKDSDKQAELRDQWKALQEAKKRYNLPVSPLSNLLSAETQVKTREERYKELLKKFSARN